MQPNDINVHVVGQWRISGVYRDGVLDIFLLFNLQQDNNLYYSNK